MVARWPTVAILPQAQPLEDSRILSSFLHHYEKSNLEIEKINLDCFSLLQKHMDMPVLKTTPSTMPSFALLLFMTKWLTKWEWPQAPGGSAVLSSSTFAAGRRERVFVCRFFGRTWYWFYQDTTKIISRKRFYIIMLSIYIGSFDFKTSYKCFLPWQHLQEVGISSPYITNGNRRPRGAGLFQARETQEQPWDGASRWPPALLRRGRASLVCSNSLY